MKLEFGVHSELGSTYDVGVTDFVSFRADGFPDTPQAPSASAATTKIEAWRKDKRCWYRAKKSPLSSGTHDLANVRTDGVFVTANL